MYILKIMYLIRVKIIMIWCIFNVQKRIIVTMHIQKKEHIYNIYNLMILRFVLINMIQQHKDYIIILLNKKV